MLSKKNLFILTGFTLILILFCYYYVDRPLVFWVTRQGLPQHSIFAAFTHLGSFLDALSALVVIVGAFLCLSRRFPRWFDKLFSMSLSLIVAVFITTLILKHVFGRLWPNTWVDNNPSLLRDNAYGFDFFHGGVAYASFPSGHAAAVFSFMTVVWLLAPRWRGISLLSYVLIVIGLIGMNYHFLSDIIGGAFIGVLSALFTVHMREKRL